MASVVWLSSSFLVLGDKVSVLGLELSVSYAAGTQSQMLACQHANKKSHLKSRHRPSSLNHHNRGTHEVLRRTVPGLLLLTLICIVGYKNYLRCIVCWWCKKVGF